MSEVKTEKACEAYYCKEIQGLHDGSKIVIQGIGRTPTEAIELFLRVKKEMKIE